LLHSGEKETKKQKSGMLPTKIFKKATAAQQTMSNILGSLVLCTVEEDVKKQQLYSRSDYVAWLIISTAVNF
jgi:hypothetical protein